MDKKHLHHWWRKIRPVSPWYLLILAAISSVVFVYAMRQNNLGMVKLRDQVFAVDKQNGDIEAALRELRKYVYSHMNTDLSSDTGVKPPIQLKYRYERLVQAEKDRVSSQSDKIYTGAQKYCEKKIPSGFSGRVRVSCIQDYVAKNGVKEQTIDESLYKFDFVSPPWTPDLAGWSLVAAAVFFLLFVLRMGLQVWVKHELHDHL